MLKRIISRFIALVVLAVVLAGAGGIYYRWGLQPADLHGQARLVYVPQQQGIWALASVLRQEGIVRSAPIFYAAYRQYLRSDGATDLPGSYFDLSPAQSVHELIHERLREPATRRVTFPEGFTLEQMAERLAQTDLMISKQAFLQVAKAYESSNSLPFRLPEGDLEGYLFPATYEFQVGSQASDIVAEMLGGFDMRFYSPNRQGIRSSRYSLHELVTIASLIEREARVDGDRRLISSVIHNRLERGMRLQIDATVQYALPEHKPRLMNSDLKVKSPYNTYLHSGLPPGPICNPGLACLEAALNPATTDYLFYVARGDGSHVFTRTYAEHLQAIRSVRGGR